MIEVPDQIPCSMASVKGLHCLPMSHKIETRLIWVKRILFCIYISSPANAALIVLVVSFWQEDVF